MKTRRRYVMSKRAEDRASRRARILEEAWRLLATRSPAEVTLAHIAEAAGVSERTVYRLFGSRKMLLSALSEKPPRPHGAGLEAAGDRVGIERARAAEGDRKAWLKGLFAFYERYGDGIINMLAHESALPQFKGVLDFGRARHRQDVDRRLAALYAGLAGRSRERRREALYALCDVYTWKLLRRDRRLSVAEARAVLSELLLSLERKAR